MARHELVETDRRVVELDRVEDRRQVLRAQLRGLLIPEPAAGLDRAADELDRVGEVGDRPADRRCRPRSATAMFIRFAPRFGNTCRPVSKPSSGSGCRIALVTSARLLTSWASTSPFSPMNLRVVVSRAFRSRSAVASSWSVLVNEFVNCGQIVVQRDELLIALVQRVDEQRQALDHREEVAATLVERGDRFGQAVERLVDLVALAREAVGEGLDDVTERTLGLFGRRARDR